MSTYHEREAGLGELSRLLAKAAAGDHSEKPIFHANDDDASRWSLALRSVMDALEGAREQEREREAALDAAHAHLREAADMKARFLNAAAHELNTPLTPIGIQLRLLKGGRLGPLTPRQKDSVEMLERNLARLSQLVSAVLDAARLRSEHMHLALAPHDVATLVDEAVRSAALQAEAAGVALDAHLTQTATLAVDAHRMEQVLAHLLSNALKFTPRGGHVHVETQRVHDTFRVSVRDDGIGMTREQTERLFLPFSQVHDPARPLVDGTGLGLFLARGIIEKHGGKIWCQSDGPGQGSTFCFALPLIPATTRDRVLFPGVVEAHGMAHGHEDARAAGIT